MTAYPVHPSHTQIPQHGRPFLAFTRKYGWVVARVADAPLRHLAAYTRPGNVGLGLHQILAVADLPPVPERAL